MCLLTQAASASALLRPITLQPVSVLWIINRIKILLSDSRGKLTHYLNCLLYSGRRRHYHFKTGLSRALGFWTAVLEDIVNPTQTLIFCFCMVGHWFLCFNFEPSKNGSRRHRTVPETAGASPEPTVLVLRCCEPSCTEIVIKSKLLKEVKPWLRWSILKTYYFLVVLPHGDITQVWNVTASVYAYWEQQVLKSWCPSFPFPQICTLVYRSMTGYSRHENQKISNQIVLIVHIKNWLI